MRFSSSSFDYCSDFHGRPDEVMRPSLGGGGTTNDGSVSHPINKDSDFWLITFFTSNTDLDCKHSAGGDHATTLADSKHDSIRRHRDNQRRGSRCDDVVWKGWDMFSVRESFISSGTPLLEPIPWFINCRRRGSQRMCTECRHLSQRHYAALRNDATFTRQSSMRHRCTDSLGHLDAIMGLHFCISADVQPYPGPDFWLSVKHFRTSRPSFTQSRNTKTRYNASPSTLSLKVNPMRPKPSTWSMAESSVLVLWTPRMLTTMGELESSPTTPSKPCNPTKSQIGLLNYVTVGVSAFTRSDATHPSPSPSA